MHYIYSILIQKGYDQGLDSPRAMVSRGIIGYNISGVSLKRRRDGPHGFLECDLKSPL